MELPSSSGLSKKPKGLDNIRNGVSCLVDGCNSDLSQCREYHRRHKVCEFHSKTPNVTIGGREQRFCQQCSRFHSLGEFDDGKRSCRKRLDSHNRRRRKPPSESLSISAGGLIPKQQGTTFLSFDTTSEQLPSTVLDSYWADPLGLENNVGGPFYNTHSFNGPNQFKIISGSDYPISEPLFSNHGSVSGNINDYNTVRVVESNCALSLLSTATIAETRGIGFEHSVMPNIQFCEGPMSQNNDIHGQGFLHNGPSCSGPGPTLSFKWE